VAEKIGNVFLTCPILDRFVRAGPSGMSFPAGAINPWSRALKVSSGHNPSCSTGKFNEELGTRNEELRIGINFLIPHSSFVIPHFDSSRAESISRWNQ
jgi:hypothetical protein